MDGLCNNEVVCFTNATELPPEDPITAGSFVRLTTHWPAARTCTPAAQQGLPHTHTHAWAHTHTHPAVQQGFQTHTQTVCRGFRHTHTHPHTLTPCCPARFSDTHTHTPAVQQGLQTHTHTPSHPAAQKSSKFFSTLQQGEAADQQPSRLVQAGEDFPKEVPERRPSWQK